MVEGLEVVCPPEVRERDKKGSGRSELEMKMIRILESTGLRNDLDLWAHCGYLTPNPEVSPQGLIETTMLVGVDD